MLVAFALAAAAVCVRTATAGGPLDFSAAAQCLLDLCGIRLLPTPPRIVRSYYQSGPGQDLDQYDIEQLRHFATTLQREESKETVTSTTITHVTSPSRLTGSLLNRSARVSTPRLTLHGI